MAKKKSKEGDYSKRVLKSGATIQKKRDGTHDIVTSKGDKYKKIGGAFVGQNLIIDENYKEKEEPKK